MLNEATLQYVLQHAHDDIRMLALRGCKDAQVNLPLALQQIQGRQTARHKLPSWAAIDGIVYPPHLNMEQCSSELTACYKRGIADRILSLGVAQIVNRKSSNSKFLDVTGGFGVDFAFMADAFDEAVYVERDPDLCALAAHNLAHLGKKNVSTICADAVSYLSSISSDNFALIYLDPARRDMHGARTYALADCTPDVTTMMDNLLRHSHYVLLKLSPMLDWRKAIADLSPHHVQEVHIVAVDNECKELLLLLARQDTNSQHFQSSIFNLKFSTAPSLFCTDIHSRDGFHTEYCPSSQSLPIEEKEIYTQELEGSFLYEPNVAVMKAGCFRELAADFNVRQLAPNSHLFTSATQVTSFPGRSFRITAITTMNKRDLRTKLGHLQRANISVRNFPLTADELRRRLKLADGGTDYIFATTLSNGDHVVILCTKLSS
ncbi:MAG: class I SAM-dependent methyltransferase [Prevotella sp.]|nr:class I SAM-dependent methyltransferase [Prevotella sp.]